VAAQSYADLEISLRWVEDEQALDVGLRFVLSDRPVDNWTHLTDLLRIDLATLDRRANDVDGYADALTEMIFSRRDIAVFYTGSRGAAGGRPIHFRLNLNLDAPPALHRVRWELLRDPAAGHPVATSDQVLFSRYLSSPDFRTVPWRTKPASRALVVIAGPTNLNHYAPAGRPLAKVDVDRERRYAEIALEGIETVYLAGQGQATVANLARELEQQVDILYLVCHGGLTSDVPFVFLENGDGTAHPVDARRLAETIFSLARRPTLALLNSCQSAGNGGAASTTDDGVLAGLGPRLAGAGISTVIAMQGNVSMETAQLFARRFFAELRYDGVVDRAVAAARRSLREQNRWDWWVPVLFSRLRSGRTYFKAEFTEHADETWEALEAAQRTGRFTPVLGPGMTEGILGSRQAIAERWADRWQMPIMSHTRQDLAKVAQYLRVEQKFPGAVPTRMAEYLQEEISERITAAANEPNDPFHGLDPAMPPQSAIMNAGRRLLDRDPGDAHRTVAGMPVPVFVTTNGTLLLEQALEARTPRRVPKTAYFPWNDRAEWPEPLAALTPTVAEPLVYHLFGRMEDPDSLVITEDDYFEWLTAWIAKQSLIPEVVAKRLTNRSLLFLGYRLDDWEFRVVFQSIKSFPSSGYQLPRNKHVGVQLSPGLREIEPEAAQDYLESYLGNDKVAIYWSETRRFLDEYRTRTGMGT
jgi:hypothetical protein